MKLNESGVLKQSKLYFSSPSATAVQLLYYPISAGHFYCDNRYYVKRKRFDSILITHILNGSFTFVLDQKPVTAKKNETVILNCFQPHEYYTETGVEQIWLHINGQNVRELYHEIVKNEGNVIKGGDTAHIEKLLFRVCSSIACADKPAEITLSLDIYKILAELLNPLHTGSKTQVGYEDSIQDAKRYIDEHLDEKLTVQRIADVLHMSPSHFSRVFRRQTGFSPYDFVLTARLNRAKDYLQKTDCSISQIAFKTGFNSESNFGYFFTKHTGISPHKFRKLKF